MLEGKKYLEPVCAFPGLRVYPIETTFRVVSRKWTVRIVLEIFRGTSRFGDLLRRVRGISSRILALRLKELEMLGVVQKSAVVEAAIHCGYELTEMGWGLVSFLAEAARFSMQYCNELVLRDKN